MEYQFQENQRVRLKFDAADLYRQAFGGSEGFVRKYKKDDVGFPMMFVEWDKTHWTYNGEEDMWTFEGHFEVVEELEDMPEQNDDKSLRDALIKFLSTWGEDTDESTEPTVVDAAEAEATYAEAAEAAFSAVADGEAMMVIAVRREKHPNSDSHFMLVPEIFSYYKTPEAGILLETQVGQVAAATHQELAGQVLSDLMNRKRGEDGDE